MKARITAVVSVACWDDKMDVWKAVDLVVDLAVRLVVEMAGWKDYLKDYHLVEKSVTWKVQMLAALMVGTTVPTEATM